MALDGVIKWDDEIIGVHDFDSLITKPMFSEDPNLSKPCCLSIHDQGTNVTSYPQLRRRPLIISLCRYQDGHIVDRRFPDFRLPYLHFGQVVRCGSL